MASIAPMIEAVGAIIINLSPSFSVFNFFELCWLQLKYFMRNFSSRLTKMIDRLITGSLDLINPKHLKNWFTKCCYCHL